MSGARRNKGGISQCRNTNLQKMFLMVGGAEKAGSGVNKIMSGWSASHWRLPYLTIETEPDRIVLDMPMFSIIPEDTLQDLRILFGDIVETLGKDELTALAVCHIEGEISNNRLQFLIDKQRADITKMLQELCKSEYLISENKSRWTTYRLNTTDSFNVDSSNVSKRMGYSELAEIIVIFCSVDYKSLDEISTHINRSEKYLRNNILPKMIIEGKLVKLHPSNHPNQKYISKK